VYTGIWWETLRERDHSEDPAPEGRIILSWIFMKRDGGALVGLIWLRMGTGGGLCKPDNEPSGFIKYGEVLD
jgi:hypothetical protein